MRETASPRKLSVKTGAGLSQLPRLVVTALLILGSCAEAEIAGIKWVAGGEPNTPGGDVGAARPIRPVAIAVVLPARAADPLAAFAARAQPGQAEMVAVSDDRQVVSASMVRVYNAASGRECRELQFGNSDVPGGAPAATYCNDPAQGWLAARPLLRGGAVFRP